MKTFYNFQIQMKNNSQLSGSDSSPPTSLRGSGVGGSSPNRKLTMGHAPNADEGYAAEGQAAIKVYKEI